MAASDALQVRTRTVIFTIRSVLRMGLRNWQRLCRTEGLVEQKFLHCNRFECGTAVCGRAVKQVFQRGKLPIFLCSPLRQVKKAKT